MTGWPDHLAALEALVADARLAVERGDDEVAYAASVSALTEPAGPLPAEHADRAGDLLAQLARLTDELSAAHSRVGRELQLHRRITAGRDSRAAPAYLDSRG
jgi:hypothetical protein